MSDFVIPAIVFRVGKVLPVDDLNALITDIKIRAKSWRGDGQYDLVLNFCYDEKRRGSAPLGPKVPYDPDGMDQILLNLQELTSVQRFHAYDVIEGRKHEKRWKTGMTPPKPGPDPANIRHGWDITRINPKFRHMIEPEARAKGKEFAELLNGYPFADKSVVENRDYIEMNVIAVLEARFPDIYDVNIHFDGALVRALRTIAEPKNQSRLPADWHQVLGCMFSHNHPNAWTNNCKFVAEHIAIEEYKAKKKTEKSKSNGIASRYTELNIGRDYITEAAEAFS
ncbi:hypothetical protein Kim5_CH02889 [Rhizobium sp. Kim5]|uniref:hypothetical protein n=1 Tax=Rhizobium sp. Kim5 TaxID=2020311 RepID=UPI00019070FE|nr:hypothetical protein [Rhizobium sp. Kim5]ARQ58932.1 hypothetical protein Kim5_CH02889 [Rhizobium sp. Kim5]